MIKQKIAAIAVAELTACSVSVSAFAASSFGPWTLTAGGSERQTSAVKKTDDLYALVTVDDGLVGGDYYATFTVYNNTSGRAATDPTDLWVNGSHHVNYLSGKGINGERYYLGCQLEKQANAVRLTISGEWTP